MYRPPQSVQSVCEPEFVVAAAALCCDLARLGWHLDRHFPLVSIMMALSKCVLDRVSERKNELKGRMYGLVEIMSRSVFARMQKRTSLYKDLVYQLVEQVFDMFKQELNEAWRDGCSYGIDQESSLNQHSNMSEEYGLDSEIEDDSLSISTLESQASSPEPSLDECIHLVELDTDDDDEEYFSIMAPMDSVDHFVLDRMSERKIEFKDRAYGLMEIMSRTVFARMVKRTSVYKDQLDQLVEQVFNKFIQKLNDAWRDGCDYGRDEWNVYSDFGDLFEDQPEINYLDSIESISQQLLSPFHSNEYSSPTQSQPLSQSQHQNGIEDDEQILDSEIMTESVLNSLTLFEASSVNFSQQPLQESQLDEEMDDGEYCEDICNNEDKKFEEGEETIKNYQNVEHYRFTHVTGNDSDLSVVNAFQNAQPLDNEEDLFLVNGEIVDDDGDNEVLDEIEHRKKQLAIQNMSIVHQSVISNKCSLTAEKPCPFAWGGCTKTFTDDDHLQKHLELIHHHHLVKHQNNNKVDQYVTDPENRFRTQIGKRPFKSHLEGVHQLVKSNKCSRTVELRPCPHAWAGCTKTFTDDDHLQKHLELIHHHHLSRYHNNNKDDQYVSHSEIVNSESVQISSTLFQELAQSLQNNSNHDISVVDCQMDGDISEDDQQFGNYDDELSVNGLSGMTNSVSIATTSSSQAQQSPPLQPIEINQEYDEDERSSQCNEDSSQHLSTQPLKFPQSLQNINKDSQYFSHSEIMTEPVPISTQSQAASPHLIQEFKLDDAKLNEKPMKRTRLEEEMELGKLQTHSFNHSSILRKLLTSDQNAKQIKEYYQNSQTQYSTHIQYDRNVQTITNDDDLSLVNGRMEDMDEDYHQHRVDQLNGLEHRENIHVASGQVVVHNKSQTVKHVCSHCRLSFSTLSDLNLHTQKYSFKKLIKFPWANCYKAFAQTADLQVHLESHTGQLPHVCHVRAHSTSSDTTQNGETNLFGSSQQHSPQLKQSIHKEEYKCPRNDCNLAFAKKLHLKRHLSTHTEELPHVCERCHKRFRSPYVLEVHIRTHINEKPFLKCSSCPYRSKQLLDLQAHYERHHRTSQIDHICTVCRMVFTSPSELNYHIKSHTISHSRKPIGSK